MAPQLVKPLCLSVLPAEGMHGRDDDILHGGEGRLRLDLKGAYGLDLIAEQLNAPRMALTWREQIDNITSHAELTYAFDHGNAPITAFDHLGHELV